MTIFLGSFLLFQVQPIIARFILPWFGGSPAVWMTCMLFFQIMLLAGYAYAHGLVHLLGERGQAGLHIALLVVSLTLLPITPDSGWKPSPDDEPTWRILSLLAVCIGAPFALLSATGPLLQSWVSRLYPARSAYPLYAVSNTASLLALLSYPFLFEPRLQLQTQTSLWSLGDAIFVLLCGYCAWRFWSSAGTAESQPLREPSAPNADAGWEGVAPVDGVTIGLWLALSTAGSVMLLATTNQLTQNVASVPFLWILPLAIYLVTFILCFDGRYRSDVYLWVFVAGLVSAAIASMLGLYASLPVQIALYSFTLFGSCMMCHGELVLLRPPASRLTLFYLMLSCGGALGGVLVSLVAPIVFDAFLEYGLGIALCGVLILCVRRTDFLRRVIAASSRDVRSRSMALAALTAATLALGALAQLGWSFYLDGKGIIAITRDFYGVLHISEEQPADPDRHRLRLAHGDIRHGSQFQLPAKRRIATTYYGLDSGAGLAIEWMRAAEGRPLRIGAVGLGVGTIAAYAEAGDRVRFYEINPKVVEFADRYFTYRGDAIARSAEVDVYLGDARMVMEAQLEAQQEQDFDVLVLDAFSGDAVPVHLLTLECFETYWRHLSVDGVLAIHVSNHHLDLAPVVRGLAQLRGLGAWRIDGVENPALASVESNWILVTGNETIVSQVEQDPTRRWTGESDTTELWTDDFSSLYRVLR